MSDEKDAPNVINPKEEGEKHTPNTSEVSRPHTSEAEPEEHVDIIHFDEDANRDRDLEVHHVTDPGLKEMGQETYDKHQEDKK